MVAGEKDYAPTHRGSESILKNYRIDDDINFEPQLHVAMAHLCARDRSSLCQLHTHKNLEYVSKLQ